MPAEYLPMPLPEDVGQQGYLLVSVARGWAAESDAARLWGLVAIYSSLSSAAESLSWQAAFEALGSLPALAVRFGLFEVPLRGLLTGPDGANLQAPRPVSGVVGMGTFLLRKWIGRHQKAFPGHVTQGNCVPSHGRVGVIVTGASGKTIRGHLPE